MQKWWIYCFLFGFCACSAGSSTGGGSGTFDAGTSDSDTRSSALGEGPSPNATAICDQVMGRDATCGYTRTESDRAECITGLQHSKCGLASESFLKCVLSIKSRCPSTDEMHEACSMQGDALAACAKRAGIRD